MSTESIEPTEPTVPSEQAMPDEPREPTERLSAPPPESEFEYPTFQETTMTEPQRAHERGEGTGPGAGPRRGSDPVSIIAGLVFFVLGGAYLLASGGHLAVNAGWMLSFLLVGLGLSGVVGTFLRSRRFRRRGQGL